MFILSRSPRELMLAAASIAVQHLLLHVFFPPLAIFIQTIVPNWGSSEFYCWKGKFCMNSPQRVAGEHSWRAGL
ncbi:hypothetical protein QL285_087975 [Trifolium repens]|nr:hypothetical protein QL285_087975 [Trifolium repens]